jgi:mono/diheme cytochrome c family protein
VVGGAIGVTLALAVVAPAALASRSMAPMVMGNATAGKPLFSQHCAACHTLTAAGAAGTVGPNLNKLTITEAQIITQITKGGASVMGKAASKYAVSMPPFKGTLTTAQIEDVAAFVYKSSH